jgi:two-component system, LuxR family, sensor kinase FixL
MLDRDLLATTTRIDILPDYSSTKRTTQNVAISATPDRQTRYRPVGGEGFQQLFHSVYDGALITDTEGNIHDLNGRASRFLAYDRSDILGHNIVDMLYGSDASLIDEVRSSLKEDKFILIQAACVRSDGSIFPAEISVNRLTLNSTDYFCFFLRDITVRQESEDRLRTGHTAIQNAANGIAVANLEGNIEYVNSAMLELWGVDEPEFMIGKNMQDFLCDSETADEILVAISRRMSWEQEIACETAGGSAFYVQVSVAPNLNSDEEITGMVFSLLDITEIKRATRELEQTLEELQRSNGDLEQFAYAISHDLQAPLRKITTFAGMIKTQADAQVSPQTLDYLGRMTHSAERMSQLISGLLQYSRISTKEKPHEPLSLDTTVAGVLSDLEAALLETDGTVNVAPLPEIAAEPTQMQQLFQNLIANAIKFHRPDAAPIVDITASLLPPGEENDDACHEIMVEDNGIGFPAEDGERIFGVFQRLHSESEFEGTGIGLAICRKIVERHGGKLTAFAAEGEGACFRIVLPKT